MLKASTRQYQGRPRQTLTQTLKHINNNQSRKKENPITQKSISSLMKYYHQKSNGDCPKFKHSPCQNNYKNDIIICCNNLFSYLLQKLGQDSHQFLVVVLLQLQIEMSNRKAVRSCGDSKIINLQNELYKNLASLENNLADLLGLPYKCKNHCLTQDLEMNTLVMLNFVGRMNKKLVQFEGSKEKSVIVQQQLLLHKKDFSRPKEQKRGKVVQTLKNLLKEIATTKEEHSQTNFGEELEEQRLRSAATSSKLTSSEDNFANSLNQSMGDSSNKSFGMSRASRAVRDVKVRERGLVKPQDSGILGDLKEMKELMKRLKGERRTCKFERQVRMVQKKHQE